MFGSGSGLDELINRPRPSIWQQFIREPCVFLARYLYCLRRVTPVKPTSLPISVVCISDTHNSQPDVPPGDILVHAGDLTKSGSLKELQTALDWIISLPHPNKVVVAGNHDLFLQDAAGGHQTLKWGDIIYLEHEPAILQRSLPRRIKVFGSPLSPKHGNWAFQYPRSSDVWRDAVPPDTDILITHGPPKTHLDCDSFGCVHLLRELWRTKPSLHVFGHVHEGHGQEWLQFDALQEAYEETVIAGGGLWNLGRIVLELFLHAFFPAVERPRKTALVNAALIGGLRDEKMRWPVTVYV